MLINHKNFFIKYTKKFERFFAIIFFIIFTEYVFSEPIKATDDEGNLYILFDNGTYELQEKVHPYNDFADKMVASIVTIFSENDYSEEQKECMKKLFIQFSGEKWESLNFANQPWSKTLEWTETLIVFEGQITDRISAASGVIYMTGPRMAATKLCGSK